MAKKITNDNFNQDRALDFESSRLYIIDKSNKRAWLVAFVFGFMALILTVAIIVMLPLKRVDLAVVKVDKNGFIDVITDVKEEVLTTSEAWDKHFIYKYVKTREQYYYNILNQDYENTQLYSDKKVSEAYISEMLNKDSGKTTIYKNNIEIDVNILSIVLNESNGTKTSTIRTELVKRNISTGGGESEKSIKVITLVYEYLPIKLNTKNRLENPLGFVVTSYRVDEEITTQKEKTE